MKRESSLIIWMFVFVVINLILTGGVLYFVVQLNSDSDISLAPGYYVKTPRITMEVCQEPGPPSFVGCDHYPEEYCYFSETLERMICHYSVCTYMDPCGNEYSILVH